MTIYCTTMSCIYIQSHDTNTNIVGPWPTDGPIDLKAINNKLIINCRCTVLYRAYKSMSVYIISLGYVDNNIITLQNLCSTPVIDFKTFG